MSTSQARVRIYTTRWCSYCIRATRVLDAEGIAYHEVDVGRDPSVRARIAQQTGWRTVPMVFIDDAFIGGCDELMHYRANHGLQHLRDA